MRKAIFALLAAFGFAFGFAINSARRNVALEVALDFEKRRAIHLDSVAKSTKTKFITDTVKLTKTITKYERLAARIDTQWLHDTVPVPVEVVRVLAANADSTIRACRDVVSSCSLALAARDSNITVRDDIIRALKKEKPSRFSRWVERGAWGAAGYTLGSLLRE